MVSFLVIRNQAVKVSFPRSSKQFPLLDFFPSSAIGDPVYPAGRKLLRPDKQKSTSGSGSLEASSEAAVAVPSLHRAELQKIFDYCIGKLSSSANVPSLFSAFLYDSKHSGLILDPMRVFIQNSKLSDQKKYNSTKNTIKLPSIFITLLDNLKDLKPFCVNCGVKITMWWRL